MRETAQVLHMIVEQTKDTPMRMIYDPETRRFTESECGFLGHARGFRKPYGWIKESGTPPAPHWDCMLMSDGEFALGDEIAVRVIGLFKRSDGDHKYVVVECCRPVSDLFELRDEEQEELQRFYPRARHGEGWFGRDEALWCMEHHKKAR